jgi:hypothetical protein
VFEEIKVRGPHAEGKFAELTEDIGSRYRNSIMGEIKFRNKF